MSHEAVVDAFNPGTDTEWYLGLLRLEGMISPDRDSPEKLKIAAETIGAILVLRAVTDTEHAKTGEVVGGTYIGDGNGIGLIQNHVVHPEYRRRGNGAKLARAAIAMLSARGITTIEALVDRDNEYAIRWWQERIGLNVAYEIVGMNKTADPLAELQRAETELTYEPDRVESAFKSVYAATQKSLDIGFLEYKVGLRKSIGQPIRGVVESNNALARSSDARLKHLRFRMHYPLDNNFIRPYSTPWKPYHDPESDDSVQYQTWLNIPLDETVVDGDIQVLRMVETDKLETTWRAASYNVPSTNYLPYEGRYVMYDSATANYTVFELSSDNARPAPSDIVKDVEASLVRSAWYSELLPIQKLQYDMLPLRQELYGKEAAIETVNRRWNDISSGGHYSKLVDLNRRNPRPIGKSSVTQSGS